MAPVSALARPGGEVLPREWTYRHRQRSQGLLGATRLRPNYFPVAAVEDKLRTIPQLDFAFGQVGPSAITLAWPYKALALALGNFRAGHGPVGGCVFITRLDLPG